MGGNSAVFDLENLNSLIFDFKDQLNMWKNFKINQYKMRDFKTIRDISESYFDYDWKSTTHLALENALKQTFFMQKIYKIKEYYENTNLTKLI